MSKSTWDEVKHFLSIDMAGSCDLEQTCASKLVWVDACDASEVAKWGQAWIHDL